MKELEKQKRKKKQMLSDDIFKHLDSLYRSARRNNNIAMALKAVEVCLKAKKTMGNSNESTLNIEELTDEALEKMLSQLHHEE